jgi:hypothetical protein
MAKLVKPVSVIHPKASISQVHGADGQEFVIFIQAFFETPLKFSLSQVKRPMLQQVAQLGGQIRIQIGAGRGYANSRSTKAVKTGSRQTPYWELKECLPKDCHPPIVPSPSFRPQKLDSR